MHHQSRNADQDLARMAARSKGIVTHQELLAAGLTKDQIRTRRKRGTLNEIHRGVYHVGHAAPSIEAIYMAAVKACGKGAAISGRAAAHLHTLIRTKQPPPPEVTAPTEHTLLGAAVHRSKAPLEITHVKGIPTTTVARTLVDLAKQLDKDDLARAVHQAMVIHRTNPRDVEAALQRTPNAKGAGTLRAIVSGDEHITLSKLERAFLDLLKQHDLELPETNKPLGAHYVDCRWPSRKLTVELDGYRYHASRHAWEQDRERERAARRRGDDFRRFSWRDVVEQPRALTRELLALLGA